MANGSLDREERQRRKALVEQCLQEGFSPVGVSGQKGSALEEACRRDCKITGFFARWLRTEQMFASHGREAFVPDFTLYIRPETPQALVVQDNLPATPVAAPVPVKTAGDHATTRADALREEVVALVTSSRYPLVNPEAIVIDAGLVRKFDREVGEYDLVPTKPRTWISQTLKVAAVSDPRDRKFIFTGAQNDADVHPEFWANLQAYADWIEAEVVVGPGTYETQWWSENNPSARSYDDAIADHLCFGQMKIGDKFVFCGEMNTLPTASKPISDLVTYSCGRWAVFPHAKRQLKSVPSTDPNQQAHQVMTTGYVTKPKVIPRKAGVKSIFHHVYGATIVEFDNDGDLFCRQITADDDGTFFDLDRFVSNGEVTTGHRIKALVCGDIHLRKLDPINALATFGFDAASKATCTNSIVEMLKPEAIFLHDIFDNESRNHHHDGDSAYSYETAIRGRDSVLQEITQVADFLHKAQDHTDAALVVVESNHDIGLERYVREGRYRNDGINVRLGLQLEDQYLANREHQARCLDKGEPVPSFSLLEQAVFASNGQLYQVGWVHDGQSMVVHGVEFGHHGFRGANGAKGTVAGYARMGRKMNIADKHSPEIDEGVYVAGCMNLKHGYNKGPSSWAIAHIVQYANGKRSIVTMQKGKWRAERPRISITADAA